MLARMSVYRSVIAAVRMLFGNQQRGCARAMVARDPSRPWRRVKTGLALKCNSVVTRRSERTPEVAELFECANADVAQCLVGYMNNSCGLSALHTRMEAFTMRLCVRAADQYERLLQLNGCNKKVSFRGVQ